MIHGDTPEEHEYRIDTTARRSTSPTTDVFRRADIHNSVFKESTGPVTNSALPMFNTKVLQQVLESDCVPGAVPVALLPEPTQTPGHSVKPLTLFICELNQKIAQLESVDTTAIVTCYQETSLQVERERSDVLRNSAVKFHQHINLMFDSKHKALIEKVFTMLDEARGTENIDHGGQELMKELMLSPIAEYVLNTWYNNNANIEKANYVSAKTCGLLAQAGGISQDHVQMWLKTKEVAKHYPSF